MSSWDRGEGGGGEMRKEGRMEGEEEKGGREKEKKYT